MRLVTSYYTLAEMPKDNGYATRHFGKWHVGPEPYSPLEHGFDVDVSHHPGPEPAGSYVAPWKFKGFEHESDHPHEHLEDRMAKATVRIDPSRDTGVIVISTLRLVGTDGTVIHAWSL